MNKIVKMKGVLGRSLADMTSHRSVSAAIDGGYTRAVWAPRLLGNLDHLLRPTSPVLHDDPFEQEMEILIASAFVCAYRRKLRDTFEGDLPRLRQLRMAIEGEQKNRAALMAHIELQEWIRE